MDTIHQDVAGSEQHLGSPAVEVPAVEVPPTDEAGTVETPAPSPDQARLDIYKRSRERGEAAQEVVETPVAAASETPEQDPDELVPLKVNGQVVYRPKSEVDAAGGVAAIQKQISGDMKLAEAAAERKRLEQERAELAEERRKLAALKTAETQQQLDADIEAEAKALSEGILLGDEERLTEAMKLVLKVAKAPAAPAAAAPTPQINTDEIAAQAAQKARYDLELENGRTEFETKFKDLATNPTLRAQANQLTVILQQQYPEWSPRKIILEAARLTRLQNAPAAPPPPPPEPTPLDLKNQRKAGAAAQLPRIAGRAPAAPQPQTQSAFDQVSSWRHR